MHSYSAGVARLWYIAIVCSVGEERMSPYAGALCLACGRSQWKQALTDGWLANRALQRDLCHRQSGDAHVVNLAGCCLHVPKHSPPLLSLLRLFQHRSVVCACVGGVPLCRRSIFSCQSLPTRISFCPDFGLCESRRSSIRLLPSDTWSHHGLVCHTRNTLP